MFRFVKNLGKDTTLCPNGMDVAKLTQKKVLQILENGVRFGKWVLLENIGEVRLRDGGGEGAYVATLATYMILAYDVRCTSCGNVS